MRPAELVVRNACALARLAQNENASACGSRTTVTGSSMYSLACRGKQPRGSTTQLRTRQSASISPLKLLIRDSGCEDRLSPARAFSAKESGRGRQSAAAAHRSCLVFHTRTVTSLSKLSLLCITQIRHSPDSEAEMQFSCRREPDSGAAMCTERVLHSNPFACRRAPSRPVPTDDVLRMTTAIQKTPRQLALRIIAGWSLEDRQTHFERNAVFE